MRNNNPTKLKLMLTSGILGSALAALVFYVTYIYLLTPHHQATLALQQRAAQQHTELVTLQQLKATYEDFLSKLTQADKDSFKLGSLLPNEQALPEIQTWAANTCTQRGVNLIYFSRVGQVLNQKGIKAITVQMEAQGPSQNLVLMLQDFSRSKRLLEIKSAKIEQLAPTIPIAPAPTNTTTTNLPPPNSPSSSTASTKATAKIEFLAYIRQELSPATANKEVATN
jgi:hypothetical protein